MCYGSERYFDILIMTKHLIIDNFFITHFTEYLKPGSPMNELLNVSWIHNLLTFVNTIFGWTWQNFIFQHRAIWKHRHMKKLRQQPLKTTTADINEKCLKTRLVQGLTTLVKLSLQPLMTKESWLILCFCHAWGKMQFW